MACEQLNRVCAGIELEPKFVDVAVERYRSFTGSDDGIVLIRDGKEIPYKDVPKPAEKGAD